MSSDGPAATEALTRQGKIPTNRLPPSQRPTPTHGIRIHMDTRFELDGLRFADEPWDALIRRLLDHWKRSREADYGPPLRNRTRR